MSEPSESKPEPITQHEFDLAMMLVGGRFPNAAFVIEKYIEQRGEQLAFDAFCCGVGLEGHLYTHDYLRRLFNEHFKERAK